MQIELRFATADLRVVPDVTERTPDRLRRHRIRVRVNRFALPEIERPDVIESHQVIGVRVREQDEVESGDRLAKQLRAQVGRRVDQAELAVALDLHGLTKAFVLWIRRCADGAAAADDWNAGRRPRSEKRDRETHIVAKPNSPVAGSIVIASPVSYHGGRIAIVVAPGITSLWWKWPKTTCVNPSLPRVRPYASINSTGSRVLCLKFDLPRCFSTSSTNLFAILFGISSRPSFVTGFFDARRQNRYFQSRSLIMSPCTIRYF